MAKQGLFKTELVIHVIVTKISRVVFLLHDAASQNWLNCYFLSDMTWCNREICISSRWSTKVFMSRSSGSSNFLLIAYCLNGMWQEVTTFNITFHDVNPQGVWCVKSWVNQGKREKSFLDVVITYKGHILGCNYVTAKKQSHNGQKSLHW